LLKQSNISAISFQNIMIRKNKHDNPIGLMKTPIYDFFQIMDCFGFIALASLPFNLFLF